MVEAEGAAIPVAERLLADAWLVEDLTALSEDFRGIAVTYDGDCFDGAAGELRRVPRGATDPALVARSQREELSLRLEQRTKSEVRAKRELEIAEEEFAEARSSHDAAQSSPEAVRRAQIEAELGVERRHAEAAQKARETRARDRDRLERRIETERALLPDLERALRRAREGRRSDASSGSRPCRRRAPAMRAATRESPPSCASAPSRSSSCSPSSTRRARR